MTDSPAIDTSLLDFGRMPFSIEVAEIENIDRRNWYAVNFSAVEPPPSTPKASA